MLLRLALLVLVAASVHAQTSPIPEIAGTWELVASRDVPVEDALVYARLTITGDGENGEIETRHVFLDPDDGELTGRVRRGRYRVNDGQLIVRRGDGVTVLDVARDGTFLTVHDLETGVTLVLRESDPAVAVDPDLIGAWTGTLDGQPFAIRFRADGTGDSRRGTEDWRDGRYVVAGPYLFMDGDPIRYTFARQDGQRRLVLDDDERRTILAPAD